MEKTSPMTFDLNDSLISEGPMSSIKDKKSFSCTRYPPSKNDEEKSTSLLELFQDSLEISGPKSRLIQFFDPPGTNNSKEKAKKAAASTRAASLKKLASPGGITEMLLNLREKPARKSSLKNSIKIKKQKTVSFCSEIELSSPKTIIDSVIFLGNNNILEDSLEIQYNKSLKSQLDDSKVYKNSDSTSSTQHNLDNTGPVQAEFHEKNKFLFEEDFRTSLRLREPEFSDFSIVAFCKPCAKETVTEVSFEKIKGESCSDITEWIMCWMMPACMYKKKFILHKCAVCKHEIFKSEY
jgi:hypothetical protein